MQAFQNYFLGNKEMQQNICVFKFDFDESLKKKLRLESLPFFVLEEELTIKIVIKKTQKNNKCKILSNNTF